MFPHLRPLKNVSFEGLDLSITNYGKDLIIMAANIVEINDDNFDQEIQDHKTPVLVDFWAPWCGPCRAIGPMIEELAGSYGDKVQFRKCNVDDNPVTPSKFGIKSIPTLIFFKDGKVADQIVGIVAKSKLEEIIDKLV